MTPASVPLTALTRRDMLMSAGPAALLIAGAARAADLDPGDGAQRAPVAGIQHPRLLDLDKATNEAGVAMAVRPPWKVAGVDYAVGPLGGTAFKPVGRAPLPRGCELASNGLVRVTGSADVVIDGYDFTGGPGFGLYVDMTGKLTVRNSKFRIGSAGWAPVYYVYNPGTGGLLTLQFNDMDGAGVVGGNADMLVQCPNGGLLAEYNWFRNCGSDGIDICPRLGFSSAIVRFNLFEKLGFAARAHADAIQVWDGDGGSGGTAINDLSGVEVYGNTLYQPAADPVTHLPTTLNSMLRIGDLGGKTCRGPRVHHNVAVGIGASGHAGVDVGAGANAHPALLQLIQLNTGNPPYGKITGARVNDNFVFTTGGGTFGGKARQGLENGPFYATQGPNQYVTDSLYARNVQMRDGTKLTDTP